MNFANLKVDIRPSGWKQGLLDLPRRPLQTGESRIVVLPPQLSPDPGC